MVDTWGADTSQLVGEGRDKDGEPAVALDGLSRKYQKELLLLKSAVFKMQGIAVLSDIANGLLPCTAR